MGGTLDAKLNEPSTTGCGCRAVGVAPSKGQPRAPEELLGVFIEAEIAARDESNCRNRMSTARHCCVVLSCDEIGRGDGAWSDRGSDFV